MADDTRQHVLAACHELMAPVIRILLRNGVMHREFLELCKQLYVEIAGRDYGLRGRPTNISRVALLTGLDRKEIKRLRELMAGDGAEAALRRQNRISRVLSGWYQDPEFSNGGRPLELAVSGASGASFTRLVQRYGGDVPASTVLKELKRLGAVEEVGGQRLRVLKRYFMPSQSDPQALQRAASVLRDLGDTLVHNLYRAEDSPSRFEGRATNTHLARRTAREFREFIESEAQQFLEKIDAWLSAHEDSADGVEHTRLGLGVYWIESPGDRGERG